MGATCNEFHLGDHKQIAKKLTTKRRRRYHQRRQRSTETPELHQLPSLYGDGDPIWRQHYARLPSTDSRMAVWVRSVVAGERHIQTLPERVRRECLPVGVRFG